MALSKDELERHGKNDHDLIKREVHHLGASLHGTHTNDRAVPSYTELQAIEMQFEELYGSLCSCFYHGWIDTHCYGHSAEGKGYKGLREDSMGGKSYV